MIDVSPKATTLRYALAKGAIHASPETIARVRERTVPKGDVLEVARAAGINAAKRCSDWMIFCHNLPLDWVEIRFEPEETRIKVFAEVKAIWRTGVEMEAMAAVTGALLNMYDMLKPLDDDLRLGDIRLIRKRGGKGGYRVGFETPLQTAIVVTSSAVHDGSRENRGAALLRELLATEPLDIAVDTVLPDDRTAIAAELTRLAEEEMDLIFTVGGTGPGGDDVTPDATRDVIERELPGVVEALRGYGQARTPLAMLSRQTGGLRGDTIIINLPGSSGGIRESVEALFPGLLHLVLNLRRPDDGA